MERSFGSHPSTGGLGDASLEMTRPWYDFSEFIQRAHHGLLANIHGSPATVHVKHIYI